MAARASKLLLDPASRARGRTTRRTTCGRSRATSRSSVIDEPDAGSPRAAAIARALVRRRRERAREQRELAQRARPSGEGVEAGHQRRDEDRLAGLGRRARSSRAPPGRARASPGVSASEPPGPRTATDSARASLSVSPTPAAARKREPDARRATYAGALRASSTGAGATRKTRCERRVVDGHLRPRCVEEEAVVGRGGDARRARPRRRARPARRGVQRTVRAGIRAGRTTSATAAPEPESSRRRTGARGAAPPGSTSAARRPPAPPASPTSAERGPSQRGRRAARRCRPRRAGARRRPRRARACRRARRSSRRVSGIAAASIDVAAGRRARRPGRGSRRRAGAATRRRGAPP